MQGAFGPSQAVNYQEATSLVSLLCAPCFYPKKRRLAEGLVMPDGRRLFQTVIPNIAPKQRGQIPTHRFGNFSTIGCCRRSNAIGIALDHLRQASKRRHKRDRAPGPLAASWLDSPKLFLTTANSRSVHSELLCLTLGKSKRKLPRYYSVSASILQGRRQYDLRSLHPTCPKCRNKPCSLISISRSRQLRQKTGRFVAF